MEVDVKIKINPLVVIIFNLCFPMAGIIFPSRPTQIFFMLYVSLVLVMIKRYKRLMKFLLVYAIMIVLNIIFLNSTNDTLKFISSFLFVIIQFFPTFIMASILIIDYNSTEILSSLEKLHLPKTFIISLTIAIRYIPTFKKEFGFIKESMRLRGIPFKITKPIKSFEYFVVPQLFRCAILAEEVTSAGLVKGIDYHRKRSSYYDVSLKMVDYILIVMMVLGIIGVAICQKL